MAGTSGSEQCRVDDDSLRDKVRHEVLPAAFIHGDRSFRSDPLEVRRAQRLALAVERWSGAELALAHQVLDSGEDVSLAQEAETLQAVFSHTT